MAKKKVACAVPASTVEGRVPKQRRRGGKEGGSSHGCHSRHEGAGLYDPAYYKGSSPRKTLRFAESGFLSALSR